MDAICSHCCLGLLPCWVELYIKQFVVWYCRLPLDGCVAQEFEIETVSVQFECEAGCTYDLKNDNCLCSKGAVADCPAGLTKCSIAGQQHTRVIMHH